MSNPVEVTPEYIAAVVEHKRLTIPGWSTWEPNKHELAEITGDIAALLTHLHANPRVPSDEEVEQIRKAVQLRFPECIDVTEYWREWAVEFQRHQFAPRKAAVPDAVDRLIKKHVGNHPPSDWVRDFATECVELGIQMGKAK